MHPSQLFDDQKHLDEWLAHQVESGKLSEAALKDGALQFRLGGEKPTRLVDGKEVAVPIRTAKVETVPDDFVQK